MSKFTPFLGLLLVVLLYGCTPQPKKIIEKHTEIIVPVLYENDMYTYVKVNAFKKGQADKKNQTYEALFLQGIDHYKNKRDFDSATYLFKQSILKYPSAAAYYELGNVLSESGQGELGIKAYRMAERLNYAPFSKVLYKISCAYSGMKELELAGKYLEYAVQAGYSNFDEIHADTNLSNLRSESNLFMGHLDRGMRGLSDSEKLFWLQFKRQFNPVDLPFSIASGMETVLLDETTMISFDFEKYVSEMRNEKFSREVTKAFYYFAELKETENYVALVYIVKNEYYSAFAPLTFRLVTFTPEGKIIDKMELAGRDYMDDPIKEAKIFQDMSFMVSTFKTEYKKDPSDHGFIDNPIVRKELLSRANYIINTKGKFVKRDQAKLSAL